ncbi:MAG: hypothetical protein RL260_2259 [Pseudomonadota bacterium]|jgi:adhesin transport system outer membrane protein
MNTHNKKLQGAAMSIPDSRGVSPYPLRQLSVALGLALCAVWSHAACDAANPEPADAASLSELVPFNPATSTEQQSVKATGQTQLAELVRAAVVHSAENRGAEHTRNAAQFDLEQTRAGRSPQAAVNASLGLGGASVGQTNYGGTSVNSVGLTLSAPLYDGGRLNALTSYREGLLSASGASVGSARERVVREAVLTVLERNRYGLQLKVYQQYVAKLACLTQSVEQIVQADPGRASERVQARKSLRQTEIARDETQAAWRQAESKLQQLLGSQVELWTAVGLPLIDLPSLEAVVEQAQASPEVRQLQQQAQALGHYARASAAEQAPQLRWQAGVNSARQASNTTTQSWNVGLALNYTLADGGGARAGTNAAQERAEAARNAWEQALQERSKQAAVHHDAARSAYQRASHYAELLRDSDTLRNATYTQWIKLGRRSLFDVISAESEHYQMRLSYVNALHEGYSASAQLRNTGEGLLPWLAPELVTYAPR